MRIDCIIHPGPRALARVACAVLALTLGWPVIAWGQAAPPAHVSGVIRDQTGAVLPGVDVAIQGPASQTTRTTGQGTFEFTNLEPGDYRLSAEKSGFEPAGQTVRLRAEDRIALSLTMRVALREQTIVTASKAGETDAQALPMAITALSGEELTRLETRSIDRAAALAPSVTFTQNSTFGQLSIRGIGTNAVLAGSDPSSAMYLDGVYLARPGMAFLEFLDLDRVEVLRGPQGTLYGRNAMGGAVNLVSRVPTNTFEASGRVVGGGLRELRGEGRVSGALKPDKVMGSVAFARGTRAGYVDNLEHPDDRLGGTDLTAARGQLRIIAGRRTDVLFSADVNDEAAPVLTYNKVLAVKPGFVVDNPPGFRDVRASTVASSDVRQYGAMARVTTAIDSSTRLVSLSAFRRMDNDYFVDADITELALLAATSNEWQRQLSQELTLSHQASRVSWVAGAFLFGEHNDQTILADQLAARVQVRLDPRVEATSGALYGQATVGLTSRLSVIGGLRYTTERKEIDNAGGRYGLDAPGGAIPGSTYAYSDAISYAAWTPKVALEMRLPGRQLAYVSATRGFKSGGFNVSSTQAGRGYDPEWAWSYEGGVKTDFGGSRARLDVAAFHMDYSNLQVQTPIGIGVYDVRNAAAATIDGVEVEGAARLSRHLDAGGHAAWLDATYDRYIAVGLGNVTGDVSGNRLNNAPEWSGRAWVEWTAQVRPATRLSLMADATAQSTVYYTPFNDAIQRQPSYGLLGATVEYGPDDRRWSLGAYARNLTETDYLTATFATSPAAFGGRPGPPRELGVQLTLRK